MLGTVKQYSYLNMFHINYQSQSTYEQIFKKYTHMVQMALSIWMLI